MNRLLIRLWGVLEDEDPKSINYQIAQTLVDNIATIKQSSSSALAELCNVSKPSISRFCKNLGYDDFYDFRAELNHYIPDRGAKYMRFGENGTDWGMAAYLNQLRNNTLLLQEPEIQMKIEELSDDIYRYERVYLMGNMQSGKTASSLQYNLHVVKKNIYAVTGLNEQVSIFQKNKIGTLKIIFSVSGEYYYALFPGGEVAAHSAGSKVWMVTSNPAVKKIEGVDAILNCGTGSDLAGSNICLEIAANLIALCYRNRH